MAWTRWHHQIAGAGLLLATGCMTPPSAPNNKIMTPPAPFPSAPTAKTPASNAPAPNMPPINNSSGMRIGPATGQGASANTNPAKLQAYDPSTQAPVQGRSPNSPRDLAAADSGKPLPPGAYAPVSGGQRIASTPAVSASTPMTSLPNMMPGGNSPFPQTGTNAPTWATPTMPPATAANFPPPPTFPAATMPTAPNPADNFPQSTMPTGNIPSAPALSIPGPSRATTYPSGSVNP